MIRITRAYSQGLPGPAGAAGANGLDGAAASFVLAAGITIPTSGAVTVTLSAGTLGDGQFLDVIINGILGQLSRTGSVYSFTRATSGTATAIPIGSSLIAAATAIALEADSVGLTVAGSAIGLKPTGADIDLSGRRLYDAELKDGTGVIVRSGAESVEASGLLAADAAGNVILCLLPEGLFADDLNTSSIAPIPYPNNLGLVYAIQDAAGKILWGVREDGATQENYYLSDIPYPNSLGMVYGIQDSEGKVLWGVTLDGTIIGESATVGTLNYLIDGAFRIESKTVGGKTVIYRTKGLQTQRLTPTDWNSSITSLVGSKVVFDSNNEGFSKSYWVDKDGSNLFYTGFTGDLFKKTIWHVIGNGQSLSEGQGSAARTAGLYNNKMFSSGIKPANGAALTAFTNASEQTTERGNVSATNLVTGLARSIAGTNPDPDKQDVQFLISHVGYGAKALIYLKKNPTIDGNETTSYANAIQQVTAAKTIANGLGYGYEVLVMPFHHGESDDYGSRSAPFYGAQLEQFWLDYNTDIKAITGQTRDLTMFITQCSSHQRFNGSAYSSIEVYKLFKLFPLRYVLICPKYFMSYSDAVAHLDTNGQNMMGDLVGAAMAQHFLEGNPWKPLYPTSITRSGATLTVVFHAPVEPIVLDTTAVTNPGSFGFEYVNTSNVAVAINSVAIDNSNTLSIVLTTATAGKLRYAYTGTVGAAPGPTAGPRGNLRDSANYTNTYNLPLSNWCVHFEEDVS